MEIGDLIDIHHFPAVVQAADLHGWRNAAGAQDNGALHEFVGGYLGYDERSRQALAFPETPILIARRPRPAGSCMRGFRTPDGTRNPSPCRPFRRLCGRPEADIAGDNGGGRGRASCRSPRPISAVPEHLDFDIVQD